MSFAVIDIGSNTIKLSKYSISSGAVRNIGGCGMRGALASCKSGGVMSDEGIHRLCDILNMYVSGLAKENITRIFPYATQSLRGISNQKEIISIVKESTGLDIEVIPGEREAELGFSAFKAKYPDASEGLFLDMGGGSTEAVAFSPDPYVKCSMPFGALSLKLECQKGAVTAFDEEGKIRDLVARTAREFGIDRANGPMYISGGTAKAMLAIYREHYPGAEYMKKELLDRLLIMLMQRPEETEKMLYASIPDRFDSFTAGALAYSEISAVMGTSVIFTAQTSARDGYAQLLYGEGRVE